MVVPSAASADLIVTIQNSTAVVGQQSFFDIVVESTAASGNPDVFNFYSIGLLAPTPSGGVSYTGSVTAATDAANGYIFPGSAPSGVTLFPVENRIRYGDTVGDVASVFIGQTFGIGRVFYDALAVGDYLVSFDFSGTLSPTAFQFGGTELDDVEYRSGTITVTAPPADVPEPSSLFLLALTGVAGVAVRKLRRKSDPQAQSAI